MSIFDHPDAVPAAPSWRCPHCGTLQPETSRCWACSRATVTCSSCHRFRTSVATDLGYCADDRDRLPLSGDEVRACWEATAAPVATPGLFDVLETTATATAPPAPTPEERLQSGPAEEEALSGAPAASALSGRLVEAPEVAPGRSLTSEPQRRLPRSPGG